MVADDPSLTYRPPTKREVRARDLRRIVLDPAARIPLSKKLISDEFASLTTVVVSENAPKKRIAELRTRVNVVVCPTQRALESEEMVSRSGKNHDRHSLDLRWLLKRLGAEEITSLLVEGGGEANASFLMSGLGHRIAFFYAPKILGGKEARRAVGGRGAARAAEVLDLKEVEWKQIGPDLFLTARVRSKWPVRR